MSATLAVRGPAGTAFVQPEPVLISTSQGPVETAVWGEGPAVLLLHGGLGGYDQGVLLARTVMPEAHRFIAISRPGYLGTKLSAGRSHAEQADLCAEVLEALGERRAIVAAISAGGPVALQLALRHPERCRALAMFSACSRKLGAPLPLRWYAMKLMAYIPGLQSSMRRKIERNPEGAAGRAIPDDVQRARVLGDPDTAALYLELQLSLFGRMTERLPGIDNDIRLTRAEMAWPLEQIAAPMLIVHGDGDTVVPFAQAEALAQAMPRAELMAIDGGGHSSIFTHREPIRARVAEFLASLGD